MSQRKSFREVLKSRTPLLLDGATGTELYKRGIFINRSFEEANLTNPVIVQNLHRDYLNAGADILSTNSWGANYLKLKAHNLHESLYQINLEAARLAREVAGEDAFVGGCVGPLGVRLEPWGNVSFEEALKHFRDQIQGLIDGGVDFINLETFSDIGEIRQAILAAKEIDSDIPVSAGLTIGIRGELAFGTPLDMAIPKLADWHADIVGLNCSVGPQPILTAIEKIKDLTGLPLIVQPNAGLPREIDGRTIYMSTPEYFAEYTKYFLQTGVQIIGGCCGTSPEHTKAMAQAFRQYKAMSGNTEAVTVRIVTSEIKNEDVKEAERIPFKNKSKWSAKIASGEKVFTLELLPPQGIMFEGLIEKAVAAKSAGMDAINIPDGPRASSRMSTVMTALMIEQKVGIETILHYTCRDRNLIGMQSDVLGAHASGLRNMLLVTGDPPKLGNYPNVTGVFDVDAIGLTRMVHRLNGGIDLGGRFIGGPTAISIGVGVNPVHRDFEYEMDRFRKKIDAGAEWAITQPVFDFKSMLRFFEYLEKNNVKIPIIAGIWPLTSLRNAQFMNNEVPGIVIPDEIMKKMAEAKTKESAREAGEEIARDLCANLYSYIQGVQVAAPFGRIESALKVIGKI
ncbi:MAG: bifunctional homocysteine S-methyltransferase/methylenetetrahydrofolate reductase [Oligoflexales bacterium]|nr:bifunctional homocysteine S-methyltransferase/methylenetetrahydrofolate reductase [Oligoflexales bacterium]